MGTSMTGSLVKIVQNIVKVYYLSLHYNKYVYINKYLKCPNQCQHDMYTDLRLLACDNYNNNCSS